MKTGSPGTEKRRILSIHPLFLLAGVLSAFTGQLLVFLCATLAALEHECAHAAAARRVGFSLDRIVLMPYGAVIKGDLTGIAPGQEIKVCLAGPFANALTALGFAALWWLFPETYPYTDVAAYVSLSLFLVNLLPAYPLDGGRILRVLLRPLGETRAPRICLAVSLSISFGLLLRFVFSCVFKMPEYGALIFCVMLLFGSVGGGEYRRTVFSHKKNFARGAEERRIAISADRTLQDILRFLREDRYLVLILFEGEHYLGELSEEEIVCSLEEGNYALSLRELYARSEKGWEPHEVMLK